MEPKDSDDVEVDKILAELGNKTEESNSSKKDDKNPFKDKKNDEGNDYEYSDDIDLSDAEW